MCTIHLRDYMNAGCGDRSFFLSPILSLIRPRSALAPRLGSHALLHCFPLCVTFLNLAHFTKKQRQLHQKFHEAQVWMIQPIPAIRYVRSTTAENAIPGPKCTATTQCQDLYSLERERDNE